MEGVTDACVCVCSMCPLPFDGTRILRYDPAFVISSYLHDGVCTADNFAQFMRKLRLSVESICSQLADNSAMPVFVFHVQRKFCQTSENYSVFSNCAPPH